SASDSIAAHAARSIIIQLPWVETPRLNSNVAMRRKLFLQKPSNFLLTADISEKLIVDSE
ncbi:MAG: hypothetical protein AB7J13_08565, partial [Pyrinomonadaceae bacterium]